MRHARPASDTDFQDNLETALARWPESERDAIRKLVQAEYRDFPNLYG